MATSDTNLPMTIVQDKEFDGINYDVYAVFTTSTSATIIANAVASYTLTRDEVEPFVKYFNFPTVTRDTLETV
jgi:hypothetical protein